MTAIIETIISRPSLNDVFFFEECYISDIDWGWGINQPKSSHAGHAKDHGYY